MCAGFTYQAVVRYHLLHRARDNIYHKYRKNQKLWFQEQRTKRDRQQKPAIWMQSLEAQILKAAIFDIAHHEERQPTCDAQNHDGLRLGEGNEILTEQNERGNHSRGRRYRKPGEVKTCALSNLDVKAGKAQSTTNQKDERGKPTEPPDRL